MSENIIIVIIVILLIIYLCMQMTKKNKNKKLSDIQQTKKNIDINIENPEYVIQIDNKDLSYIDDYKTSVDTLNLYPDYYPYTFGFKPYYYRLYPYPLRPQFHYHKKAGTYLF